jgi:hypothetical protein
LNAEVTFQALSQDRIEKSLFAVNLRCFLKAREIGTYPPVDKCLPNEKEQELELKYKHKLSLNTQSYQTFKIILET